MNHILKSEHPEMFKELAEFEIARIKDEHRRGSTFYRIDVVQFHPEHVHLCPTFTPEMVGTWKTNQYVWSEEDTDDDAIHTLTRVEKKDRQITVTEWVEVVPEPQATT